MVLKMKIDPAAECSKALAGAQESLTEAKVRSDVLRTRRIAEVEARVRAVRVEAEKDLYEIDREHRSLIDESHKDAAQTRLDALAALDATQQEKYGAQDCLIRAMPHGGYELVSGRRRISGYVETTPGSYRVETPEGLAFYGDEASARMVTWSMLERA